MVLVLFFTGLVTLAAQGSAGLPGPGYPEFKKALDLGGIMKMPFPAMLRHAFNDEQRILAMLQYLSTEVAVDLAWGDMISAERGHLEAVRSLFPIYNSRVPETTVKPDAGLASLAESDSSALLGRMAQIFDDNAALYAAILKHPLIYRIEHGRLKKVATDNQSASRASAAKVRAVLADLNTPRPEELVPDEAETL